LRRLAALASLGVVLAGCGGNPAPVHNVESCDVDVADPARAKDIKPLELSKKYTIEFQTTMGNFTVQLDPKTAPCNGDSMLQLARDGFFDGIPFHRIIPGYIIQGGHSLKTPDGGPGYTTVDEPLPETQYLKGDVAMAKGAVEPPGTGGSEFFIVTGKDIGLPSDYAVLGKIVEGMDVVDKIGKLGNAQTEAPTKRIVIKKTVASTPP
jgi:cyclophilin family peptidyl-prolyl cis-trans isomerase